VGAFLCFVGHGAFGFYRKEAWVPYFAVVGIGRDTARALMPWVGMMDISVGLAVLLSPRRALLAWMMLWATWTAILRPLAGEPAWEALERAGNYGVPLAFLLLSAPGAGREWWRSASPLPDHPPWRRAQTAVAIIVALLFLGHGALALAAKPGMVVNMASLFPTAIASALTRASGALEIAAALVVLRWPTPGLAFGMAAWKLGTEALFIVAGAPAWEVVERGGSYAAPIALGLILLLTMRRGARERHA
jgi:hypothetical protein